MKCGGIEGAYYDGRCFPVDLHTVAKISQEFLSNESAECTRWTREPRLTSFLPVVTVLADSESGIHAIHVLLPRLPDTPPSSAAATRVLPSNANLPFAAYLRIQKLGTLFAFRCRSDSCRSLGRPFRRHVCMASSFL
ncbi:hypothetical protein K443DRAFT_311350 [Laccaria amethystina LaAM-08-1]|uniref:Uncharacterized protein n=1 Tax=Laccaria amethystina LaAM-08-1 TaxID=1095629 RepID=A0A0C9WUP1_9AGAR|nr:hypothetical protein K443DRAFT_311350 [Laccaria amethystina LaAM-08-1]